jgi:hypothetical protein
VRHVVGGLRLLAAAVGLVALVGNFVYVLGFSTFTSFNYFSYFTQQSNMSNVVVLVGSGVAALRGRSESPLFVSVHALVTTYVIVSGIVYGIIVAESLANGYAIGVPWSSQVLHFWIPSYVLVDWVLAPGRSRISWKVLGVVLVYPVVWGVATIVRGADVGWYPYFFLDPAQVSWPGEFLMYNAIALGTIVGVLTGLIALSHLRPRGPLASTAPPPGRAGQPGRGDQVGRARQPGRGDQAGRAGQGAGVASGESVSAGAVPSGTGSSSRSR